MPAETTQPTTTSPARIDLKPFSGGRCVAMHGLDWKAYSAILRARGDRAYPKMVYLDGSLWLMSPGFPHDFIKTRAGRIVDEVCVGVGVPCIPSASTTFRRRKKRGGFEGDQSYYFADAHRLRGLVDIDLRIDPPPDLVIEVVYTHAARATIATCRRLGVPEMWICDERAFRILVLQPDGKYAEAAASASMPFLTGEEIEGWLRRPVGEDETRWALELRRWVGDVLAPRARGGIQP